MGGDIMTKEMPSQWQPTDQIQKLSAEYMAEGRKMRAAHIEQSKLLEEKLKAEVVGIWGHQTPVGSREYAVYRKKEDGESYFVVLGKKEDFESYDAPDGVKKKAKRLIMGPRESLGEYEIKFIDPEHTPNNHPIQSIEEFIG